MFAQFSVHGAEVWSVTGWTMLHYLWLGAIAGAVAMVCRLLVRRAPADVRYAVALVNLAVLVLLPVAIAGWLIATSQAIHVSEGIAVPTSMPEVDPTIELNGTSAGPSDATISGMAVSDSAPMESNAASRDFPLDVRRFEWLTMYVPYLPWLWLVGTPLTFVLLATGVVGAERLRRGSYVLDEGPIAELCIRLRRSLGVSRRVTVAICERIATPVLVGILRPVILLPPSALTGWSPDEIEMVLLHELAHARRWDNLVNLIQRLIESLLFFHPAVWLVSSWVRQEREACCDALVVSRTRQPHAYAEMLVALAAQMPRSVLFHPVASSAMSSGRLRTRIHRILQLDNDPMLVSGKSFGMVLGGLLVVGVLAVLCLPVVGEGEEPDSEVAKDGSAHATDSEALDDGVEISMGELRLETPDGEAVIESVGDQLKLRTSAATRDPDIGRVILSIPGDQPQVHWPQLFEAVDAAREKGQYVDLVPRGESFELVVAREPRESDWPAMLGDPPRKERVIADRAWQVLGLKFVPASLLETWDKDVRGRAGSGIKIIGGNVPKGLPLPAFLMQIDAKRLDSFDALNTWLSNINSAGPFKVYAAAGGHDYLFDTQEPTQPKNVLVESTSPVARSTKPARFPSLEEQKLADLAYRRLGLEMEPIGEEDLKRVQAMGYDGGLKVTSGTAGEQGRARLVGPGDILVGLHVWPTTTMQALADVLNRDDLVELNPLKYYVVRRASEEGDERLKDFVFSGRVTVPTTAAKPPTPSPRPAEPGAPTNAYRTTVSPLSIDAQVEQALAQDPLMAMLQHELMTLQYQFAQLAKDSRRGQDSSSARLERQIEGLEQQIAQYCEQVKRQIIEKRGDARKPARDAEIDLLAVELENVQRELKQLVAAGGKEESPKFAQLKERMTVLLQKLYERATKRGQSFDGHFRNDPRDVDRPYTDTLELRSETRLDGAPIESEPRSEAGSSDVTIDRSNLRYDGKTFDQWRDSWRNELSTERRTEAVKALAAYGAAGYGKEAAQAILDVAREYDWMVMGGDSPVSNLKKQTIAAFAGGADVTSIPMGDWLPAVTEAVRSGDKNMDMFAYWVFSQLNIRAQDDIARLIELSRDDRFQDKEVRFGLLQRLGQIHSSASDPRIAQRLVEALKNPDTAWVALTGLYGQPGLGGGGYMGGAGYGMMGAMSRDQGESRLEYRPELVDALKHNDRNVRSQVIQVLALLGPKARPAVPRLLPLLLELDEQSAAQLLATLGAITGFNQAAATYLNGVVEQAPSGEQAKRARELLQLLRELDRMRQKSGRERGSARGGEFGFGREGGYGRGMRGEDEEMGRERAEMEQGEAAAHDLFGPADEGGGRAETSDNDLFGPATPDGESGGEESAE